MSWLPTVVLTVNESTIPQTVDWSAPLLGVDSLSVDWGTANPLEQAPPSAASFSLLDLTSTWATSQDVIGLPVTMGYTATNAGQSYSRVFFRGRITGVDLNRVTVTDPAGAVRHAVRVDAVCASLETDLANRFPLEPSWPAESFAARRDRLVPYCAGVATAATLRDVWNVAQAAPVDRPGQTSIRDHLVALYNSCGGDRMVYSPALQAYTWLARRNTDSHSAVRLWTSASATEPRYGQGAYLATDFTEPVNGGPEAVSFPGLFLDAGQLEYPDGLSRAASTRITRAQLTSKDADAGNATRTVTLIAPKHNEPVIGVRAVTLDSIHNWNSWADLNASDLLAMATQETATWTPGPVRWRPARFGGFAQSGQMRTLLRGFASNSLYFLGGSWLSSMRVRPLFGVNGGRIAYTDGEFVLTLLLAGVSANGGGNGTPDKQIQHAVTWEDLAPSTDPGSLVWTDAPHPAGLHTSVNFEDLGYTGRGLESTSISPTTDWDSPL